jgi:hypothetical protein
VVKAQHILTGKFYAIKLINNIFKDEFAARKLLREIHIQRVLSKMERNIFTIKIFDIITPELDLVKFSTATKPTVNLAPLKSIQGSIPISPMRNYGDSSSGVIMPRNSSFNRKNTS